MPNQFAQLDRVFQALADPTRQLAPRPLKIAEHWMAAQQANWERRLDQLVAVVKKL